METASLMNSCSTLYIAHDFTYILYFTSMKRLDANKNQLAGVLDDIDLS